MKMGYALSLLTIAAGVAACGGGGSTTSGDSPMAAVGGAGSTANASPDAVSAAGTLQTLVPPSTYSGTLTLSAFDALNKLRLGAGAGLVAQSAALDIAASAHAHERYLTTNLFAGASRSEDATKPEFYAATPNDRMAKAGLAPNFAIEVMGGTGVSAMGGDCVAGLLNTLYHSAALSSRATSVGFGFGADGLGVPPCVADLAAASSGAYGQFAESGPLIAYPFAGQTGVLETFYVAFEVPRPSEVLFPYSTAGMPVIVNVRSADYVNFAGAGTLNVGLTQFQLKDRGGNLVPAGIRANTHVTGSGVTPTPDSNLGECFVVLVPLSPLVKGMAYTATFAAMLMSGSSPISKTWTLTTSG